MALDVVGLVRAFRQHRREIFGEHQSCFLQGPCENLDEKPGIFGFFFRKTLLLSSEWWDLRIGCRLVAFIRIYQNTATSATNLLNQ